jgi:hypothetical protein
MTVTHFSKLCAHMSLRGSWLSVRPAVIALTTEDGSIKIKNKDYWRNQMERESAINSRRERVFV